NLPGESYQAIFLLNLPVKSRENKAIFPFIGAFVKFQGFIQIWFVTKQELEDIKKFLKMEISIDLNSNIEVEYDDSGEQSEDEYNEPLELYEGQVFKTAEEAYITVETFAYSHEFGIRKGHVEKDPNGHEISRTFLCRHAGKPLTEKKSHKTEASGSCRTDYKWKVNIYWSKRLNQYRLSTFTNSHTGHTLDLTSIRFIPKSRRLTDEMLKEIEYYTLVRKLNASAQYRLLSGKYQVSIHRHNLYNAISKFKRIDSLGDNDASKLLSELLKKKDNDPRWCYPKAAQYLNKALYPDRHSWARAYTFRHFTADAQATSRVKSINSHIKAITRHGHITLCDLFNSLDSLIAEQDYYYDFISWKSSNPNIKPPNICDTMYMNVDAILKAFVAPNIIEKIRYEINHSLFYHTSKISPESLYLYQ
ncbi:1515_t:CDS:2, partial [Cetraspora pellucida]